MTSTPSSTSAIGVSLDSRIASTATGESIFPLTTVWTPPAGCPTLIAVPDELNRDCQPPNFSHVWHSTGYYSPGICPNGYTGCWTGMTSMEGVNGHPIHSDETVLFCAASGYACESYWNEKVVTVEDMVMTGTQTTIRWGMTYGEIHTSGWFETARAPVIEVRWRSSDEAILESIPTIYNPYAASPTSGSGYSSGSGRSLSKGAIAGIVMGAITGVLLLVGAAFFLFRRRRRRAQYGNELDGAGVSSELDGNSKTFEMDSEPTAQEKDASPIVGTVDRKKDSSEMVARQHTVPGTEYYELDAEDLAPAYQEEHYEEHILNAATTMDGRKPAATEDEDGTPAGQVKGKLKKGD